MYFDCNKSCVYFRKRENSPANRSVKVKTSNKASERQVSSAIQSSKGQGLLKLKNTNVSQTQSFPKNNSMKNL